MKKIILIIILIALFFSLAGFVQAITTIVEDYPKLPACQDNKECRPGEAGFGLPQFIKYIFLFSLGIVGIVGFIAILIAAFGYVTSVGNPQKAAEAKDRIVSALLGLLLLLGSYVILNIINPDLLKLKMEAKSVKVEIEGGEEEEGCRYISARVAPTALNVGDSFTLTLKRQNCPNFKKHRILLNLKQTKGSGTTIYSEVITNGEMLIETEDNWVEKFTFIKAINMIENEPEEPFLEGWIEIPNQSKQYIPRINMILRDLKEDGTCCN